MGQGKHVKILGLSFLVLVGVMAVSASTAQANWLILLNGQSVSSLPQKPFILFPWRLLVENLGLSIECEGGEGGVSLSLSEENKKLSGSTEMTHSGCEDLEFGEVCDVHSEGDPAGTIEASGGIKAEMDAAGNYYLKIESSSKEPFTTIAYSGEFCPLEEIDGTLTGYLLWEVLNALSDTHLKQIHLVAQELEFGETPAELHDGNGGPALSYLFELNPFNTWGLHLVGPLL